MYFSNYNRVFIKSWNDYELTWDVDTHSVIIIIFFLKLLDFENQYSLSHYWLILHYFSLSLLLLKSKVFILGSEIFIIITAQCSFTMHALIPRLRREILCHTMYINEKYCKKSYKKNSGNNILMYTNNIRFV